jgi:hypothetical protein
MSKSHESHGTEVNNFLSFIFKKVTLGSYGHFLNFA